MHTANHTTSSRRPARRDVEGAVCVIDAQGQVQCNFDAPKRSRVLNPSPNGQPTGLPPSCVVDLATGKWACPGHAVDGSDAKVQRVFTDDAGHHWAVAGDAKVVVPAVRAVAVGALGRGGREVSVGEFTSPTGDRQGHPAVAQPQPGLGPNSRVPDRRTIMSPEQQMMALAGAAPQQGVAVGACGPMAYNPNGNGYAGMAGMGQAGFPGGVMGCQPAPPATNLVQDCATYQECFVPLGISFGVDANGNIYPASLIGQPIGSNVGAPFFQLFPRNGWFYIFGVKFFQGPGNVQIDSVITGDSDFNHVLSSTDVATWNTTDCFCPVNWGCVSVTNSLKIQAHAVNGSTLITGVRGSAWGIRRASLYACGPQYQCGPGGYGGGGTLNGSGVPVPAVPVPQ